jgi:hypothetical protein
MIGGHPIYVLDTNVFIEAANRYYAFDIVPRFWQLLIEQARIGQIQSIDRVKAEIDRGEDDLNVWANSSFKSWFASTDMIEVIDVYKSIIEWAAKQKQFAGSAKAEISRADNADPWLVAYALSKNYVVVTHEQPKPEAKKTIPIPNICQAFDVHYVDVYQMLRELRVKLC